MYLKYSCSKKEDDKWDNIFSENPCSNLLQAPAYGIALGLYSVQKKRLGFIYIEDKIVGIFQLIEASLFGKIIHAMIVDRGPLWLNGYGCIENQKKFWELLNKENPRRWGRKRRFIPEMEDGPETRKLLRECGLKRHAHIKSYETVRLDLTKDIEDIRAGFKKNWRGALSKAERSQVTLEWDNRLKNFSDFLAGYREDKTSRSYNGASPRLLQALAKTFCLQKNMIIGTAKLDNRVIATILILRHGRSATYQAGWTTDEGRKCNAHHYLLWDLLRVLKELGVYDLDLGGVNEETADGIRKFKEGMGGEKIRLVGAYY